MDTGAGDGRVRVGLEATGLMNPAPGGIALYTRYLADALAALPDVSLHLFYKLSRFGRRRLRYRPPGIPVHWHYNGLLAPWARPDVAHSADSHFLAPRRVPKIITVHDLAIFRPELTGVPGYTSDAFRQRARTLLIDTCARTDAVIAVSHATKNDLLQMTGLPPQRVHVVYPAPCLNAASALSGIPYPGLNPKSYLLFVGDISLRKNIPNVLQAFSQSGLHRDYKLVLAGKPGMGSDQIDRVINASGIAHRVVLTGYVPETTIRWLYRNAQAFAFPTFYEGFGIPALEAMLYNVPVVAGNIGAAPEVTAGYAVTVDPFSAQDIARGLLQAVHTGAEALAAARAHAAGFTWERAARQTLAVYRSVLDS